MRRFLDRKDVPREVRNQRRRDDDTFPSVWEVANEHKDIRVGQMGPCAVLLVGTDVDDTQAGAGNMPTCHGQGFIAVTRDRRRFRVIGSPFRRSGHHGWFHDRRSSTAHPNEDGLPVVSTGFLCASDRFNYLTGCRWYSIRATYLAPECLSPAHFCDAYGRVAGTGGCRSSVGGRDGSSHFHSSAA